MPHHTLEHTMHPFLQAELILYPATHYCTLNDLAAPSQLLAKLEAAAAKALPMLTLGSRRALCFVLKKKKKKKVKVRFLGARTNAHRPHTEHTY